MRTYILLAVVACALASPIDDRSTVLSSSSKSNGNPDISTLPLNKDSNSTLDSGVHAHPLHKRDSSDPPKVADKTSQKSSPAPATPTNLSVNRPVTPTPILSQNSRVKRDAPRVAVADQKSAVTPKPDDKQKQDQSSQQLPKTQTTQETRKTRDAPKPADANAPQTLNKKPEEHPLATGQKSDKPAQVSQFARTRRDAPNPHEQSKIVPSAIQPSKVNDDKKSSETVTASPPLIAKSPQHKRESVQQSTNTQSPTFVHPVPVDQILKKTPTNASVTVDSSKLDTSHPAGEVKVSSNDQKLSSKS